MPSNASAVIAAPNTVHRMANRVVIALGTLLLFSPQGSPVWWSFALGVLLAAIPASMAERMLATRTGKPWIAGMQQLTREADASTRWRLLSWSSLGASLLMVVLMASLAGMQAMQVVQMLAERHDGWLGRGVLLPLLSLFLLVLGGLRSQYRVPVLLWLVPLTLMLVALLLQLSAGIDMPMASDLFSIPRLPPEAVWAWSGLALAGGGGVIWSQAPESGHAAPRAFWQMAVLIGGLTFVGIQFGPQGVFLGLLSAMLAMLAVKVFLEPLRNELLSRGHDGLRAALLVIAAAALLMVPLVMVLDADLWALLLKVAAAWMAFNMLVICLFAGWVVKVSHARKTLRLPNETVYNVWRVLVRWTAPIVLLMALFRLLTA